MLHIKAEKDSCTYFVFNISKKHKTESLTGIFDKKIPLLQLPEAGRRADGSLFSPSLYRKRTNSARAHHRTCSPPSDGCTYLLAWSVRHYSQGWTDRWPGHELAALQDKGTCWPRSVGGERERERAREGYNELGSKMKMLRL